MITRRSFAVSAALTAVGSVAAASWPRPSLGAGGAVRPVVAELFTSQGCNSCPPADAFLGVLAGRSDVIALAYHIDYWDRIGWPDPFADAAFTTRQRGYRPRLGNHSIYTPQIVIDGEEDAIGSRTRQVENMIALRLDARPAERPSVPVHAALVGGALEIEIPDAAVTGAAEVVMVAYDARHETEVRRGENAGRTLVDHNVVRVLRTVARYDGTGGAVSVPPGPWSERDGGVAVLLQATDHGPIWGATQLGLG